MALFTCIYCGKLVSDKAQTCPHCGAPVAGHVDYNQLPPMPESEEPVRNANRLGIIIGVVVFLLGAIGIGGFFMWNHMEQQQIEETRIAREQAVKDSIAAVRQAEEAARQAAIAAEKARQDSINKLHQDVIDNYLVQLNSKRVYDEGNATHYYLYDVNKDGIPELWITGSFGVSSTTVYMYSNGTLREIYQGSGIGHSTYHIGKDCLLAHFGHMGSESLDKLVYKNGKIVRQNIFEREQIGLYDEYRTLSEPKVPWYESNNERYIRMMFN